MTKKSPTFFEQFFSKSQLLNFLIRKTFQKNVFLIIYKQQKQTHEKMPKFSFTAFVPAPLDQVWEFFSKFQNIPKWDPNTKSVSIKKQSPNIIGTIYDVKTQWKGEQQSFEYEMTGYQKHKKIQVEGKNFVTKTVDQIYFEQKSPGTNVRYVADISLRHILKIMTPFIQKDLEELAKGAQQGFKKKSNQLFGA